MPHLLPRFTPTRWTLALLTVFIVALAFRAWAVVHLLRPPQLLTLLSADADAYWRWASYLREHGPFGRHAFFMGPLYPYWLYFVRTIVGDSIVRIVVIQCVLGALSAVLVTDAIARLSGRRQAVIVGLLFAGYGMAVFMDLLLLTESLALLLECLLLWTMTRTDWVKPRTASLVAIGTLIGLLALGRATSLALVMLPAFALWSAGGLRGPRVRSMLVIASCVVALALPALWRNHRIVHEWIPYTYNLGLNFYIGNGPLARGSYETATGMRDLVDADSVIADGGVEADGRRYLREVHGVDVGPSASSRFWFHLAADSIACAPGRWAGLLARKTAMVWNWCEFPQLYSVALYRTTTGVLGWPYVGSFAVLAPLAFAGLTPARRLGRRGWLVIGYALVVTASCVAFFVVDRYRLHLVPAVAILAGLAVGDLLERRSTVTWSVLFAIGLVVVTLPLPFPRHSADRWEVAVDFGEAWLRRGDPETARHWYEEAVAIADQGILTGTESPTGRRAMASMYTGYGETLVQLGRVDESVPPFEHAIRLAPESASLSGYVAQIHAVEGHLDRSLELFRVAGCDPHCASAALVIRAAHAIDARDSTGAAKALAAAAAFDPANETAWVAQVRLFVARGAHAQASEILERARAAGLRAPVYFAHVSLIAIEVGDRAKATDALGRVPPEAAHDAQLEPLVAYVTRELASPAPR